jgi:RNA polymerase sigma-70 factor (ECF subfamily)
VDGKPLFHKQSARRFSGRPPSVRLHSSQRALPVTAGISGQFSHRLPKIRLQLDTLGLMTAPSGPNSAGVHLSDRELGELRSRIRFKVGYEMGFYCPDVEDIVQETLTRFLTAARDGKIQNPEAIGAFANGVCRNVISEFRRRNLRSEPILEAVPEPPARGLAETDAFELRQAVAHGLDQLPSRDRNVLRAYYLKEKSKAEILAQMGLTDENFRVILFRAKEKFRAIYSQHAKHHAGSGH